MSEMSRSEIARQLGSISTPKKREAAQKAAQAAAKRHQEQRRPLSEIECTCGAGDSLTHARKCPRYMAIRYRKLKGYPLD